MSDLKNRRQKPTVEELADELLATGEADGRENAIKIAKGMLLHMDDFAFDLSGENEQEQPLQSESERSRSKAV